MMRMKKEKAKTKMPRGAEAEKEAKSEKDVFRPSLSDLVADGLLSYGSKLQDMVN